MRLTSTLPLAVAVLLAADTAITHAQLWSTIRYPGAIQTQTYGNRIVGR